MNGEKILRSPDGTVWVQRFSSLRRVEHLAVIVVFVVLVVTGFPQKFYGAGWAARLLDLLGGLGTARTIHRVAGLVFVGHAALHLLGMLVGLLGRRMRLSLLPVPQDLHDAWQTLRFYLGFRHEAPPLPKFDYRQKFEYIGIVLGGLVMITSGLCLLFPAVIAGLLPGEVIPAARVAHSNEALLALLVLIVWHVYGSHLSPEIFPMDRSIFTGYIEARELKERHLLEYQRLFPDGIPAPGGGGPKERSEPPVDANEAGAEGEKPAA
jgi:cytochrome b subunit of formate dehydrogenase